MKDSATIKAKKQGLRARSAFKLQEIQRKYGILKRGQTILDLGAWPGGWSLIAAKYGKVYGIDLKLPEKVDNCTFIKGDVFENEWLEDIPELDVVMSDMAPKTSGNRDQDQFLSFELSERALEITKLKLRKGGSFVCKIFQGPDFKEFYDEVKKSFKSVGGYKPPTSKDKSKEMYIVAIGFQG
jgi:23S rRNA (uridine2552-2'-O)-methyltransferase